MNIPKLRFKGFNDEWKSKQLREIATFRNKKNNKYKITDIFSNTAEYGVVSQKNFFNKKTKITNDININGYYIVHNNDFIYNPRISNLAPYGPIKRNKLGKSGIVSPLYLVFSINNDSYEFMEYYFNSDKWYKYIYSVGNSGARSDRVSIKKDDFFKMLIFTPCNEEECKIGALFAKLDNLIDLQAKKLELLKQLKQGLLQKLFPQNNQTIPQLRFKGFNEEWKEKKLGELGIIKAGNTFNEKEQGGLKGTPFYKVSDMNILGNDIYMKKANNYVTNHQIKLNRYNVIKEPSIIFAKVGAAIFLERKRIANNFIIDNNMMFFTPSKLLNIKFSLYLFNNIQLSRYAQIGSLPSYNASDISLIKILITNIQEQQKISSLLTNLDNLLTKAQEKITLFKQVKKYLLQRMFI